MPGIWGDIPSWLTIIGGLLAFAYGLQQYWESQRWKRVEFVSSEIDKFLADPKVATALLLSDYSRIRLDRNGTRASDERDGAIFDDALITSALIAHTEFKDETESFSAAQMLVRESYDALLSGLERFGHHLQAGLVTADDLRPYLAYWIRVLADPTTDWKPDTFYFALHRFIRAYSYSGVEYLFQAFGYKLVERSPA
jgi:hypothetical protein